MSDDFDKIMEASFAEVQEAMDEVSKEFGNRARVTLEQIGFTKDEFRVLSGIKPIQPFKISRGSWMRAAHGNAYDEAMKAKDAALEMAAKARAEASEARAIARRQREEARSQWREEQERRRQEREKRKAHIGTLAADDDTVPNPNEDYRAPGKVDVGTLLDEVGLAHKKIICVAPNDGVITHEQEAIIEKLNRTQGKYLFIMDGDPADLPVAKVPRPGFWARLFGWFRRKKASQ